MSVLRRSKVGKSDDKKFFQGVVKGARSIMVVAYDGGKLSVFT
jgi:hypothetical protein